MNKETVLHSFLICVLLSSVLLLVGCTQQAADSGNVSPETDLPAQESSEPQSEDVLTAYNEAARLYDWFDLAPMPLDESDSVREGENTYFRVLDENITSTKELHSRLEEVFTSEPGRVGKDTEQALRGRRTGADQRGALGSNADVLGGLRGCQNGAGAGNRRFRLLSNGGGRVLHYVYLL